MKKINIVPKKRDFQNIIENGIKSKNTLFYIYILENGVNIPRFGIAVSKKIGNAVVRNKIKRQIKDIIDNMNADVKSLDYVLIVKKNILGCTYYNMKEEIEKAFISIYKGEK